MTRRGAPSAKAIWVVAWSAVALLATGCSTSALATAGLSPATATSASSGQRPSPGATSVGPGSPTETPLTPSESLRPGQTPPPLVTQAPGTGAALPACAYKDKDAEGDPDRDWDSMVLDTIYKLPADFAPRKLVDTSRAGMQKGFEVIPAVVDDLGAMHGASIDDDAEIAVRWAYRSYAEQQGAFAFWVRESGEEAALKKSARPGHSEHQLGTAVDFRSADSLKPPWEYEDWADTIPGDWMLQHAWRFGFVLSYPEGAEAETCYGYEPWHYRYVGRDLAKEIHASGLTPRAFLWARAHPVD